MYGIGDTNWPGLGKLVEEMGELQQALAKLISTKGEVIYWDGTNLVEKVMEEMADVFAAHWFFMVINQDELRKALGGELEGPYNHRVRYKQDKFMEWHQKNRIHNEWQETFSQESMDEPQGSTQGHLPGDG